MARNGDLFVAGGLCGAACRGVEASGRNFFQELVLSQIRSHTFQIDGGHKAFAAVLFLHLRPAVFVALDFFDLLFSDKVDKPFVF